MHLLGFAVKNAATEGFLNLGSLTFCSCSSKRLKLFYYQRRRHRSISELSFFFFFFFFFRSLFSFWSTLDIVTIYPTVEPIPTV